MTAKATLPDPAESAPPAGGPTHERILAGARRYFFAHGFRGVTMDDLASELGMSKKTLYAHYPSKMALLEAVVLSKIEEVEVGVTRVMEEAGDDFSDRLQALLVSMREHTSEISEAYLRDVRREAPEIFTLIEGRRRALIQRVFGKLLQEGRKAGRIRKDIPPAMMMEMLLGAVDAVVNPTKMEEMGLTPKTAFQQIVAIFLDGVIIREGGGAR